MKKIIFGLAVLGVLGVFFAYPFYKKYKGNNVSQSGFIIIPRGASLKKDLDSINPYLGRAI